MKKVIFITLLLFVNAVLSQVKKNQNKIKQVITNKTSYKPAVEVVTLNTDNHVSAPLETPAVDNRNENFDYSQIYTSVEINPEPEQGINNFRNKFADNFNKPSVSQSLVAIIVSRFVVNEDGSITDVKIIKETPDNLDLGTEFKRVLSSMPKWKPGVMNGRNVKVYYTLPIHIKLLAKENSIEESLINENKPTDIIEISNQAMLPTDNNTIYTKVSINPVPPGGINAFRSFIGSNFKLPIVYKKTTATVIGKFVVLENGSIGDIVITKEEPLGLGLADEFKRVVKSSSNWQPGVKDGKNVKVYYLLPIKIEINEKK